MLFEVLLDFRYLDPVVNRGENKSCLFIGLFKTIVGLFFFPPWVPILLRLTLRSVFITI